MTRTRASASSGYFVRGGEQHAFNTRGNRPGVGSIIDPFPDIHDRRRTGAEARPLLTDPARGDLRILLDTAGLGSDEVSIGERTYRANYTSAEHVHQGIEILYVLEGEFQHEINGRTYVLKPGMIGVVKVGDTVRHKTGGGPVKLLMIWAPGEEGARVAEGWRQPGR